MKNHGPIDGPGWRAEAACQSRQDLGWLAEPENVGLGEEATMAVLCDRCPVRAACAAYVDDTGVTGGFWAGHHRTPSGPMLPFTGEAA